MVTLFHHPFCPHSRFVRIVLGEYGATAGLVEERTWERREGFLALNPDGTTPVLVEDGHPAVPGPHIIAEYLDEVYGPMLAERRLLPIEPFARVEVRRLASWFNDRFLCRGIGPAGHRAGLQAHHDLRPGGRPARFQRNPRGAP
jgi:glutathione S-transferase